MQQEITEKKTRARAKKKDEGQAEESQTPEIIQELTQTTTREEDAVEKRLSQIEGAITAIDQCSGGMRADMDSVVAVVKNIDEVLREIQETQEHLAEKVRA